jgi:hypothetical protein
VNSATYTLFSYRAPPECPCSEEDFTCPREALDVWEIEIGNPQTTRALVRAYSSNGRDAVTLVEWSCEPNATPLFA